MIQKIDEYHTPALLNETIDLLNIRLDKKYIDATLGGGGHSEEILKRGGMLLGIDQDPEAVAYAGGRLLKNFPSLKLAQANFVEIDKIAKENGFEKVDGIVFDLGASSHQLEEESRGFSFNQEGPLDMRMNSGLAVTAKDLVNGLNEWELTRLFLKLGEEKSSKKYAKAICAARKNKPIETCKELALIIAPKREGFDRIHPATRVFQALRIAVNDELNSLKDALPKAIDLLNKGGRIAVLSFHSLEDGIIKKYFLQTEQDGIIKIINKKPIVPSGKEVKLNPRARSAKLRGAEKL